MYSIQDFVRQCEGLPLFEVMRKADKAISNGEKERSKALMEQARSHNSCLMNFLDCVQGPVGNMRHPDAHLFRPLVERWVADGQAPTQWLEWFV